MFVNKRKLSFTYRFDIETIEWFDGVSFISTNQNAISKMVETGFKLRRRNRIDKTRIDSSSKPLLTKCQFDSPSS